MVRRPDVLLLIAALLRAGCGDPPDAPPAEPVGAEELGVRDALERAGEWRWP